MDSDEDLERMATVYCPFCDHGWRSKPDWRVERCPNCGLVVQRHSDLEWD